LNCLALLCVAVFLRCFHLANLPGMNGDEAWSGVQALRWLRGESISWWTPTGNPLNWFYFVPLVALHAVAPPSFALLRLPALVTGLLALPINYALCRRAFDSRTAVISTWLLALLPIDIAYSRFGWDASQSLLATLLVMYLALIHFRRRPLTSMIPTAAVLALVMAIWVHPTNVFAAPLVVVPALYRRRQQLVQALKTALATAGTSSRTVLAMSSAAVALGLLLGVRGAVSHGYGWGELGPFAENYLRLFSGATVYEFVAGIGTAESNGTWFAYLPATCNLIFGCLAIAGLLGLLARLARRPASCNEMLVLSWFTMAIGFFVIAGPVAIAAHHERYGICLVAPGALVLSRGLAWWIEAHQPRRVAVMAALGAVAWLMPLSFYLGYFTYIERTGGSSHLTFRTAAVEPKQQALEFINAHRLPNEATTVVCHEWWNYWPLEYLALGQQDVRVLTWEQWQGETQDSSTRAVDNTWFVDFVGTAGERETRLRFESAGTKIRENVIRDYAGRALLTIVGPVEKFSQNY
jgi:hypothetical protein